MAPTLAPAVGRVPRGHGFARAFVRFAVLACLGATMVPGSAAAQSYWVYVAAESEDEVALLRYDAGGDLTVEKTITTGWLLAEIEAPHGLAMDPGGEYWYLTLGHGFPNGRLVKYVTGADTVAGVADLGLFPATIAVPPHGTVALTVNANFHGDHIPSTVTIVDLETMFPLADVVTCTMPHGSRFNADGTKHYSACMMDNQLVEIDGATLAVSRRLDLVANEPAHAPMDGHMAMAPPDGHCSPTWTTPHTRTASASSSPATRATRSSRSTWRNGASHAASRPRARPTISTSLPTGPGCSRP